VYTLTVEPTGTDVPPAGEVETTVVAPEGPYGPPATRPRADSEAAADDGDLPVNDGTVTGWGPRDTWTDTEEPNGWTLAAAGVVPITWSTGTVDEYVLASTGAKPAAVREAAADA